MWLLKGRCTAAATWATVADAARALAVMAQ
jgi:hypothetical protein